jgi:RNA polymerase sigma-70 factor (ECF subfamily)
VTGRDEAFCLDVVHDVMMRVIRSIKPMDDASAIAKWLRVTVRSCAIDRLREERRRRDRESALQITSASQSEQDGIDEQLVWLRGELARLDPDSAALLAMRHRFNWTLQRIGTALGIRTGAVDRRLRTTIEQLRTRAGEVFDE